MIRLITGATRLGGKVYRPADGAFTADKKTEEYLVKRGVAVYVDGAAAPTTHIPEKEDAPVIEVEAPTVEADTPKKPAAKKPTAKKS